MDGLEASSSVPPSAGGDDYATLLRRYHAAHDRAQRAPLGTPEFRVAMSEVSSARRALEALTLLDERENADA